MAASDEINRLIEYGLGNVAPEKEPYGLYAPIKYAMEMGGKRLRPRLCLMACDLFGGDLAAALKPALGLEVFHNFTLLHDDIMDRAELRRGKPTVYKAWSENGAILSGDAMLIEAYKLMASVPSDKLPDILKLFSDTATEVCEGQQYDMDFESRNDVAMSEYMEMIRLKTAVLLACSLKMGAVLGGASDEDASRLYDFGINLGLAFQLRDDYLDVFGDSDVFGKALGGDILCWKKTFLLIEAYRVAGDAERAELSEWAEIHDQDEEKIAAVTEIYRKLHVDEACQAAIDDYCARALAALDSVDGSQDSDLRVLAEKMSHRDC